MVSLDRKNATGLPRRTPSDGLYPNDRSPSERPRAADRRVFGDAHVHLLLARGRHRPQRPRILSLLRRRHRRAGGGSGCAVVHPRHHAVQLCRARGVRRKLLDVYPRRRLPRGQGGPRRRLRQAQRLGADVRLHSHRPDLRRVGRPVHHRPAERTDDGGQPGPLAAAGADGCARPPHPVQHGLHFGAVRRGGDHLLLVAEHQGHRGVERQGAARHADHHRDGDHSAGLGLLLGRRARRAPAAVAHPVAISSSATMRSAS